MKRILFALTLISLATLGQAQDRIMDFRVQHSVEPLEIEDAHPVFSWKMESSRHGAAQSAYRIQVVRESDGGDFWDSGKVDCSISDGIAYKGVALQPDMGFKVHLSVWDDKGQELKADTRFETGLMNRRLSAWNGAQWIGSKEITLDAASECIFSIETDFKIRSGKASLLFGADDFRLGHAFLNDYAVASGENYIRVDVTPEGLDIYRVGYFPGDRTDIPVLSVPLELSEGQHRLVLAVEASVLKVKVDGKDLLDDQFSLNIMGSGGNYLSFPNLNSVGFAAAPGSDVEYRDYRILKGGHSVDRVSFDERRYGIFKGLPGVSVREGTIVVSNTGGTELKGWADPSHGAETQLRTEFQALKKVKRARLFASAMGIYNLFLNGKPVDDDWFSPGDSQYRKTLGYRKYDVTALVQEGTNALAASLAGGWWSGYMTFSPEHYNFYGDYQAFMARLVITYEDGSKEEVITSPDSWKAYNDGPVRLGSFFQGERYDARKETTGWMQAGFDDSSWTPAERIEPQSWIDFDLVARYDGPVRVRETLTARRLMPASAPNAHIYDMGVNMVGVPEITIPAGWLKEGDTVILTYGEQVFPGLKGDSKEHIKRFGKKGQGVAGHILYQTNRTAMDTDFYTASGPGEVTIRPTKTFRGYQYIQVYIPSHEGALPLENVKGLVLSSSELPTSRYTATTSDGNKTGKLVNQLFLNIQRSLLGNFLSIPTDCPQRNERMGWMGDAQAFARSATYQSDLRNFYRQWLVAIRDDRSVGDDTEVAGGIGSIVPDFIKEEQPLFLWGTTWSAAVCQIPWQLYSQYGDLQVVREHFETMMDWLNGMAFYKDPAYPYLSTKTDGLADHLALDERTPRDLLNNAIYIRMIEVTAIMADAIGRTEEANLLRKRHALAVEDWNRAYVDPATGKTKGQDGEIIHTQSSYATPLNYNCFNEANKARAVQHLADLAVEPVAGGPYKPYTITTGFAGTSNFLPALSRGGRTEEAYQMISCADYPSWLYPVTRGATSVWERWNSWDTAFAAAGENGMNSFNHYALGAVGEWMSEYQLGVTGGPQGGYKHFVLQPTCGGDYTSLEGCFESSYGRIESAWTADKGVMTSYRCTVPANTTATVYLPVEGQPEALGAEGATFTGFEDHLGHRCACFELTSGSWTFTMAKNRISCK